MYLGSVQREPLRQRFGVRDPGKFNPLRRRHSPLRAVVRWATHLLRGDNEYGLVVREQHGCAAQSADDAAGVVSASGRGPTFLISWDRVLAIGRVPYLLCCA